LIAQEPHGGFGDFIGGTGTAHGHGRAEFLDAVRHAHGGVDFGVDQARPDADDPDALAGDFLPKLRTGTFLS
jgi:hypothetical protein